MPDASTTLVFRDLETGKDAVAIVRRMEGGIALCLSHSEDGDVEVFMNERDGRELLRRLGHMLEEPGERLPVSQLEKVRVSPNAEGLFSLLVRRWKASGVQIRPGVDGAEIEACRDRLGSPLPDEVAAYFRTVDGMPDNVMDDSGMRFWRISEIVPAVSAVPALDPEHFDGIFVFADYMIWSHAYGLRLVGSPHGEVVIVGGERPIRVSATFSEFVTLYLDTSDTVTS
jgi:hypothetical protein